MIYHLGQLIKDDDIIHIKDDNKDNNKVFFKVAKTDPPLKLDTSTIVSVYYDGKVYSINNEDNETMHVLLC